MAPPYVQQGPYGTAWQPDDQSLYVLPPEAIIPPEQTQYVDQAGALPPPVVEPVAAVPPPAPPVVEAPVEAVPVSVPVATPVAPPVVEAVAPTPPAVESPPVAEPLPVVNTPWGQYGVTDAGEVISPDGLPVTEPRIREAVAAEAQARNQERISRLATEASNQEKAVEKERDLVLAKARESEEINARAREELIVKSGEVVTDVSRRIADYDINAPEKPGWKKALALISVAMSGIGMALDRKSGPNPAIEILMRGAQEEAQARRATYEKLLGDLGMAKDEQTKQLMRAKSAKEAYHTSEAATLEMYTRMADQIAKRANTEKERISGLSVAAKLRESTAEAQRKAAIERAEQTRKEAETAANIAADKSRIYLDSQRLKLDKDKFASDEETKKYNRANPDPEQELKRIQLATAKSGVTINDPLATGERQAFQDKDGNDIVVDPKIAESIRLSQEAANEILGLVAKNRGLLEDISTMDKMAAKGADSSWLPGLKSEAIKLYEQNAANILLIGNKGAGAGTIDSGTLPLMKSVVGDDVSNVNFSKKTLDNLIDNLEAKVNVKIQTTGKFGSVRSYKPDGTYTVGPRAYKLPNLVIPTAKTDPNVAVVMGRYWGRPEDIDTEGQAIADAPGARPSGSRAAKRAAVDSAAMENLLQQARSGAPDKLFEVARSAGPLAKKAARAHLVNLAGDRWAGMSEAERTEFKAKLALEEWFQNAE